MNGTGEVPELITTIHSSLGSQLQNVVGMLTGIEDRIKSLEARQKSLEDEVRHSTSLSSSPGSDCQTTSRRKRATPAELQVHKVNVISISVIIYVHRAEFALSITLYMWIISLKLTNRKITFLLTCTH